MLCLIILFILNINFTLQTDIVEYDNFTEEPEGLSLEDKLYQGLKDYMQTGVKSEDLHNTMVSITQNQQPGEGDVKKNLIPAVNDEAICIICNVIAKILITYRDLNLSVDALKSGLKLVCRFFQTDNVCNGAIELNTNIFVYIIDNKKDLSPSKICSIIGQAQNCEDPNPFENVKWKVNLPPAPRKRRHILPRSEDKKLRILHVTDIHFDDLYKVGGNADCEEPLCCGVNQGEPKTPEARAGAWGDYRKCDMPWHSVVALMKQLVKHQDIDYVYHTGDIVNHRVWETSVESNSLSIRKINRLFLNAFGRKGTPVFPVLGNHEPNPLDVFSPTNITRPDLSTHWLYNLVADDWSYWLPQSTQATIRKGGYYTVLVKPGFRIIALNSNVAYIYNWWLLYNDVDPYGQLQWLADTLYAAELNNEIVHILTHVPVGDGTVLKKWSHEYGRIIKRFAHIIAGQFCGHTHYDELHYFYNEQNSNTPINIAFNGGSFTTFTDVNPNYRIYDVDSQSMNVENFEEWIYNVTEANKNSKDTPPLWYKLYSFKEAYGLESMSLKNMGKLLTAMTYNQTLLNTYYRFKVRDGDTALQMGCNRQCHETNICNIATTEYGKMKHCDKYLSQYRHYLRTKNAE